MKTYEQINQRIEAGFEQPPRVAPEGNLKPQKDDYAANAARATPPAATRAAVSRAEDRPPPR